MTTIAEIKDRNHRIGHFFFHDESLDWFGSVVYDDVVSNDGYDYFITSEQDPEGLAWDGERRWSIRACDVEGRVTKIGRAHV